MWDLYGPKPNPACTLNSLWSVAVPRCTRMWSEVVIRQTDVWCVLQEAFYDGEWSRMSARDRAGLMYRSVDEVASSVNYKV